jgi:hypothetical protein
MKAMHRRCAGLDVHQQEIVACHRIVAGRKVRTEIGRFSTTTRGLLELADWLEDGKVTHVAMEATGVYWKPVWHVLHGRFTLILANAAHIRNVPGRKSDVNDATWIAELLAHGLIRASFVPPQPIQELRDLTRTRKELTRVCFRPLWFAGAPGAPALGGAAALGIGWRLGHRRLGLVGGGAESGRRRGPRLTAPARPHRHHRGSGTIAGPAVLVVVAAGFGGGGVRIRAGDLRRARGRRGSAALFRKARWFAADPVARRRPAPWAGRSAVAGAVPGSPRGRGLTK